MHRFAPALISSPTARPSMFAAPAAYMFHPAMAGSRLGQTGPEWLGRARTAVARWEELGARVEQLTNRAERGRVETWIGDPAREDSPAYRYVSVKSDLMDAESKIDPGADYADANPRGEARQTRIEKLENFVKTLGTLVANAEAIEGRVPVGAPLAPGAPPLPPAAEALPGWVLPVAVGGGALLVALTIGLLAGK